LSLREEQLFDDLNGRFRARVRTHTTSYLKTSLRGSEVTLQSSTAVLETKFDMEVLDKLHSPSFVGVERPTTMNPKTYLICEVVGVRATHLQELGVKVSMPGVLREEFLRTIEKDWEEAKENWIDVVAAPSGYLAKVTDGSVDFERTTISPLTGKQAHLLSKEAVGSFVCTEGGAEVGQLIGLEVPITSKIDAMIRYHTGIFGFTGTGKSNLTSVLIRKAIGAIPSLRVVVFDVAGEYAVNLLDLLGKGIILTPEKEIVEEAGGLVRSQVIPESLEGAIGGAKRVEEALRSLHSNGKICRLVLTEPGFGEVLLKDILEFLITASKSKKPGAIAAKATLGKLMSFMAENGMDEDCPLYTIVANEKLVEELKLILMELKENLHGMSSELKAVETILSMLEEPPGEMRARGRMEEKTLNPEQLAELVLSEKAPRLVILYVPDLMQAREAAFRYVDRLLELKKKGFSGINVLTVLDEAQEFVPDRAKSEDYTDRSNIAIETLLRQGRKYRAGCWLSTQRVAHLNVNALQQLHTYFASTLPRYYDRMVIADAYSLDYEVLNRVAELDTGEWLFVSYKATKRKNVPVFIRTPDNEKRIVDFIRKYSPSM